MTRRYDAADDRVAAPGGGEPSARRRCRSEHGRRVWHDRRMRRSLLLAATATMLLLAACGDDDDSSPTTAAASATTDGAGHHRWRGRRPMAGHDDASHDRRAGHLVDDGRRRRPRGRAAHGRRRRRGLHRHPGDPGDPDDLTPCGTPGVQQVVPTRGRSERRPDQRRRRPLPEPPGLRLRGRQARHRRRWPPAVRASRVARAPPPRPTAPPPSSSSRRSSRRRRARRGGLRLQRHASRPAARPCEATFVALRQGSAISTHDVHLGDPTARAPRSSRSSPSRPTSLAARRLTPTARSGPAEALGADLEVAEGVVESMPGSFGRPSTRSPTMFFITSSVPPAMRMPGTPSTNWFQA